MSDGSLYERYGRSALKVVVAFLAATSLAGAALRLSTEGLAVLGDAIVSVYVAVLLVWGVFFEGHGTARFRVALYTGIVLWGVVDYTSGAGTVTWVLIGLGALLLVREVVRKYRRERKPVYER